MNGACRLCLRPGASDDIFQNGGFLMSRIVMCCRLQPYIDDGLPSVICGHCQMSLDHIWNFQALCHESDQQLRNNLTGGVPVKCELGSPKHEFDESTQELDCTNDNIDIEEVKIEIVRSDTEEDARITEQPEQTPEELKFQCDHCFKQFQYKSQLELHVSTKHIPNYECEYCRRGFANESKLDKHIKSKHLLNRKNCSVCGKSVAARGMLNHFKRHLNKSETPQKTDVNPVEVKRRRKPEEPKHECVHCHKKFARRIHLESHITSIHLKQREPCPVCGKFISPCGIANHMRFHQRDPQTKIKSPDYRLNPYKCNVCHKKFINQINLILHSQSEHHNEDGSHVCPVCNTTVFVNDLVDHLRTHQSNDNQDNAIK